MKEFKINGSKCVTMPFNGWNPEQLSSIWSEIINDHGADALHKPMPGHTYKKRYNSLTEIDRPFFKRLPAEIEVLSPPRLFRSTGWKYKGRIYLDCDLVWEFKYRYIHADEFRYDWMAVRLLSYCYTPATLKFSIKQQPQQLSLFDQVTI